jgi:flagellin-like protein
LRKHRGISEILSSIILIVVVVSGMVIYEALSRERIFADTMSVSEALKGSESKATELLTGILFTKNNKNGTAYIINYGFKNVTIANLLVGEKAVLKEKFDTYMLRDTNYMKPLGKILPVLPTNSTVRLFINQTISEPVAMVTESGRVYQLEP